MTVAQHETDTEVIVAQVRPGLVKNEYRAVCSCGWRSPRWRREDHEAFADCIHHEREQERWS